MSEKTKKEQGTHYVLKSLQAAVVIAVVKWLWPWALPLDVFSFWSFKTPLIDGLMAAWPCLVWALVLQGAIELFRQRSFLEVFTNGSKGEILRRGFWVSLWAGTSEEICFRWILFLEAIIAVRVLNFLFFGFLGFGVPEWFHGTVWGPLADFTTLHRLHDMLFHPLGWTIGAGMLVANSLFREGHTYQGLLGVVNSWFLGMFFFWLTFNYGLVTAIIVHFLYDMVIFTVVAVSRGVQNRGLVY